LRQLPLSILLPCLLIMGCGFLGLHRADQLYGPSRLFERQLTWVLMAVPLMLAVTWVPYRQVRHLSPWFFCTCVVLLVFVLFCSPVNGSRRWIPLGFFDLQPSEPSRLAYIMLLAYYLMYRENQKTVQGLIPPFVITLLPLLLILREPDLGTAMLFLPILYAMLFAAGARLRHLVAAALIGVALLPLLWQQMSGEQRSRVVMVFTQQDGGATPSGDGFHLHQSKQVLALGGFWGSIYHDEPIIDDSQAYVLPAARTDFILCVLGERYGVPGLATLLLLYSVLVIRGFRAAAATQEPWGRLVAVGIVTMIATQTLINVSMTVGLMPITGITLPLCSYGGSSLLSTSLATGLLMNICMRPGYEVAPLPFGE
jgi:cell division protein FtsW (lipid II flippase)